MTCLDFRVRSFVRNENFPENLLPDIDIILSCTTRDRYTGAVEKGLLY